MTTRLIKLLTKREEMCGLSSDDYDGLYELLKAEVISVGKTLEFYAAVEQAEIMEKHPEILEEYYAEEERE